MNVGATLEPHPKPAILMQPRDRSLHHPSKNAQPAAVPCVSPGDQRRDSETSQLVTVWFRVIPAVGDQDIRPATRTSGFSSDGRDGFDQRDELRDIVRVRSGENHREWNPVTVGDHVMFASVFPSVSGVRADFRPPKTALTEPESTTARDHSILSA